MVEPEIQEPKQEDPNGDFHTHANLTQALVSITAEHFKNTHANADNTPVAMPAFMAEAVHMIFSNIAAASNGNPFFIAHWQNAATYCQAVANILSKTKRELTEKSVEDTV